jgi:hypothetical protein
MSYEGHTKVLCANGHLSVFDAHSMPITLAFPGHVEWRCPTCKAEKVWSADVDQTNGIDPKTGLCPGDVKLRVKNGHACICPTCGKKHTCADVQYHIPKTRAAEAARRPCGRAKDIPSGARRLLRQ